MFCIDGLIPFIESAGYKLIYANTSFTKTILNLLFRVYQGKQVLSHPLHIPHHNEHYDIFEQRLNESLWNKFWSRWGDIQDFQEGGYAYSFRLRLRDFIWSWVDFYSSPTICKLEKELQILEDQEEFTKGKEDPYLQENTKRDYSDRHW